MEAGVSGFFDISATKSMTLRVNYQEEYELSSNKTTRLIISLKLSSAQYSGTAYYLDGSISIDGKTVQTYSSAAGGAYVYVGAKDIFYDVTGGSFDAGEFLHNTDGTKSITLSVKIKGYTGSSGGGSGWSAVSDTVVDLAAIARASSIAATDANIGSVSAIIVNRKSSDYSHSIAFNFQSLSGFINADGNIVNTEEKITETNIAFRVPTSWYSQIPGVSSADCELICRTYSDSGQIGDDQTTTFSVIAAPSTSSPDVSGTVKDTNEVTVALTGDENTFIRYHSTAFCEISASAKNGAEITEKRINGTTIDGNSATIENVESGEFVFWATDSRGYSAQKSEIKTLIPYIKIAMNGTISRADPTSGNAELNLRGNFFSGSFGKESNSLTLTYRVGYGGEDIPLEPELTDSGFTFSGTISGLDYDKAYTITITASDKLETAEKQLSIQKGIPVFDWGENDFVFHVPVTMESGLIPPESFWLSVYPVGSIYLSTNSTSPEKLFGGKWERLEDCFLLAGGSKYKPGTTGGEAEHTLTEEELPEHTHEVPNITSGGSDTGKAYAESWGGGTGSRTLTTSSSGSGNAHNNMPPYLSVYAWRRLAAGEDTAVLGTGVIGKLILGKES